MGDASHLGPDLRLVAAGCDNAGTQANRPSTTHERPALNAVKCGVADDDIHGSGEPSSSRGAVEHPVLPSPRRAWNTRAPAGATRDGDVSMEPLSRETLLQRIDLTVPDTETDTSTIADLCVQAVDCGVISIAVPPSTVGDAVDAIRRSSRAARAVLRATIKSAERGRSLSAQARVLRQAVRDGARGIDIVMDTQPLRAGRQHQVLNGLRRLVHEARDARAWIAVVLECNELNEIEQVTAARLAARVRPDVIAAGAGIHGGGTSMRQLALIREAAGGGPVIRAVPGRNGLDAEALLDAGAGRLGIAATTDVESLLRSTI